MKGSNVFKTPFPETSSFFSDPFLSISSINTIADSALFLSLPHDIYNFHKYSSISIPTYPGTVNCVESIFKNGLFKFFAIKDIIKVFPTPDSPVRSNPLFFSLGSCSFLTISVNTLLNGSS